MRDLRQDVRPERSPQQAQGQAQRHRRGSGHNPRCQQREVPRLQLHHCRRRHLTVAEPAAAAEQAPDIHAHSQHPPATAAGAAAGGCGARAVAARGASGCAEPGDVHPAAVAGHANDSAHGGAWTLLLPCPAP